MTEEKRDYSEYHYLAQRLEPRTREEWQAFIAESLRFEFQELVHGAIAERVWTMEQLAVATGMPLAELKRVISDTPAPDITLQEMAQVLAGFPGLAVELRERCGQPAVPGELAAEVLKSRKPSKEEEEEPSCGGPREACCIPGCEECGQPKLEHPRGQERFVDGTREGCALPKLRERFHQPFIGLRASLTDEKEDPPRE